MTIGIISHPKCVLHEMGEAHPESPDRVRVIETALKNSTFIDSLRFYEALPATRVQIERAHSLNYIAWLSKQSPAEGYIALDQDTTMNPFTLEAALLAAGSLVMAVDLIMKKEVLRVFCNVRPPGHHAERNRAMGFCFFNNIAIGVLHALEHYKLKKIAIVDFDVHHGNGTEDILEADPRVLFCSSYQHPFLSF